MSGGRSWESPDRWNVTGRELAEALWLAALRPPTAPPPDRERAETISSSESGPTPSGFSRPEEIRPEPVRTSSDVSDRPDPTSSPAPESPQSEGGGALVEEDEAGLFPWSKAELDAVGRRLAGRSVRLAAGRVIPHALELGRALRPLRRPVPSPTRHELDETRTVELAAETRIVTPVIRPRPERRFVLHLVAETGGSMPLQYETLRALARLTESLGIFRAVRRWTLQATPATRLVSGFVPPDASPDPVRDRGVSPKRLTAPEHRGRALIVLVGDGTSDHWRDGSIAETLRAWGQAAPTAYLSLLPSRLWESTSLPLPTIFVDPPTSGGSIDVVGAPNARLRRRPVRERWRPPDEREPVPDVADPVPILELDPDSLGRWAALVAGSGEARPIPALRLTGAWSDERREWSARSKTVARPPVLPDPDAVFEAFSLSASPEAFALARATAAAAPLSLPILRLIRDAVVPGAGVTELTEVFLGGLWRPVGDPTVAPEARLYDFLPGLRSRFLGTLGVDQAMRVLRAVARFLAEREGYGSNFFDALLVDPQGRHRFPVWARPFALMAADVLDRYGGSLAPAARSLRRASTPPKKTPQRLEARVIVLGLPLTGKTSLIRGLSGKTTQSSRPEQATTIVERSRVVLPHPDRPDREELVLDVWELDGANDAWALLAQPLKLLENAVVLLVWDRWTGRNDDLMNLWLFLIRDLSPTTPILLVENKADSSSKPGAVPVPADPKRRFPAVVGGITASSRSEIGREALRVQVARLAERVAVPAEPPEWNTKRSRAWQRFRQEVGALPDAALGAIEWERLFGSLSGVSRYHKAFTRRLEEKHGLIRVPAGKIDAPSDLLILKPEQVVLALGLAVRKTQDGWLTDDLQQQLWGRLDPILQHRLTRLLPAWDLAYRPERPADPSEDNIRILEWMPPSSYRAIDEFLRRVDSEIAPDQVRVRWRFDGPIPPGLFSRLTARLLRYEIEQDAPVTYQPALEGIRWFVIGSKKQDGDAVRISMRVFGRLDDSGRAFEVIGLAGAAGMFHRFREEWEEVFDQFPGLVVEEFVPCPSDGRTPCRYEFRRTELLRRLGAIRPRWTVECPACGTTHSVLRLIVGPEAPETIDDPWTADRDPTTRDPFARADHMLFRAVTAMVKMDRLARPVDRDLLAFLHRLALRCGFADDLDF